MKPVSMCHVPSSRSTVTVFVCPPRCSPASNSVSSWRPCSLYAATSPETPPPTIAILIRRARSRGVGGHGEPSLPSVVTWSAVTTDHDHRWRKWETDRRMTTTLMKREAAEIAPTNGHGTEPQTLSSYIQSRFDECSRSQKDVAQYIIDHLDEAAFQTAEELARRANTSSSTVVRFSQALGF